MPRALLVSWLFPPHASIGAKRAYRFARHLPALGWDVTVLCGREPPARFRDPTRIDLPTSVRVVADYDPAWLTRLANRADTVGTTATPGTPSPVRAALDRMLHDALPTETIAVHLPHALRVARDLVRRERPDVVWTTSYPYSAHALGLALRRTFGIPWVADLRDPWSLNFVHDRKWAPTRWLERAFERRVFENADAITVTTEALANAYRAKFPDLAARFDTIRNGFDAMDLPPRAPTRDPVRFVHFGHVYGERTLGPFFHALARLRDARGLTRDTVVLENFGRLSEGDRAVVRALHLEDLVSVREPMPYAEGVRSLRQADLLLLPAWGTERGALFLPGKLYDYLLAGAPVLAVGRNDELARILRETHAGMLADPDDGATVERCLANVLDHGDDVGVPDPGAVDYYSARHAAERLVDTFDTLTRNRT